MRRYLIDTAIWIDLYEDRTGYNCEPLGEYGWKLLSHIQANDCRIVITDFLMRELENKLSLEQITGLFKPLEKITDTIFVKKEQWDEARFISMQRNVPTGDVVHAIIARDNSLFLVTRDNHFKVLADIARHYKPEELI